MQPTLKVMTHFPVDLVALEQQNGVRFPNCELVEICSTTTASLAGGVVEADPKSQKTQGTSGVFLSSQVGSSPSDSSPGQGESSSNGSTQKQPW